MTKKQINQFAKMFVGITAINFDTGPEETGLTEDEIQEVCDAVHDLGRKLLGKNPKLTTQEAIAEYVKAEC